MPFEPVENLRPASAASPSCPTDGVTIRSRQLASRSGGEKTRYLQITIGQKLAARLCLRGDSIGVAVSVGTGSDHGRIGIAVDAAQGGFTAKRAKKGTWAVTLNRASCDGLFSLDVEPHARAGVKVVEAIGKPPMAVIEPDAALFALDD